MIFRSWKQGFVNSSKTETPCHNIFWRDALKQGAIINRTINYHAGTKHPAVIEQDLTRYFTRSGLKGFLSEAAYTVSQSSAWGVPSGVAASQDRTAEWYYYKRGIWRVDVQFSRYLGQLRQVRAWTQVAPITTAAPDTTFLYAVSGAAFFCSLSGAIRFAVAKRSRRLCRRFSRGCATTNAIVLMTLPTAPQRPVSTAASGYIISTGALRGGNGKI